MKEWHAVSHYCYTKGRHIRHKHQLLASTVPAHSFRVRTEQAMLNVMWTTVLLLLAHVTTHNVRVITSIKRQRA